MSEQPDPLARIGELAGAAPVGATDVAVIHRRSRRRRALRHATLAMVAVAVLAVGSLVVLEAPGQRDEVAVDTADVPATPATVPDFTRDVWESWDVPGVVDRAGRAAPVYRRDGRGDGLVVVLGPSAPCIDRRTCGVDRPSLPTELGFMAPGGPLGTDPAVFVPSWSDDLHVGRSTDVRIDGLDSPQQFVGARNVETVVRALADDPTLQPDRIVLAGSGGGGVGAMVHAATLAAAFPQTPIVVLIDAMVVPGRDSFDACLLDAARAVWGAAVPGPEGTAATVQKNLAAATPAARFVVIVHRDDPELRRSVVLPGTSCDPTGEPVPVATYRRAVETMDEEVAHWRIVQIPSSGRSVLDRPEDDSVTARVLDALEQEG